ncbi:MAG: DNA-binding protein YbiB [Methylobacillus sp.]|jgi:anthranilate phosphoribosyltransferase|nr:DNA-binding protein YbiB [Methylobacillus sp.]
MDLIEIIKEVGRGKDGAGDLSRDAAYALYGAMLRGEVPDLELGALLIAFRIKGESDEEMLGFYHAMQDALPHLQAPAGKPLPVVIPSYNGARRQGNLTPLLALLLARQGVPVLVHGVTRDPKRVVSAEVFAELDIAPCRDVDEAQRKLDAGEIAFLPIEILSPEINKLLQLRWRLGLRNSTHTLVKLADPFHGQSARINSVTHPEYLQKSSAFLKASGARAILLRGTEGEVYANPKRCPEMLYFNAGEARALVPAEEGSIPEIPDLPGAMDAVTTAVWIRQALTGEVEVPRPIALQAACCLYASGATDGLPG